MGEKTKPRVMQVSRELALRQSIAISLFALGINLLFQFLLSLLPSLHPLVRSFWETIAISVCIVPFGYFCYVRPLSGKTIDRRNAEKALSKNEIHYKIVSELTSTFVFDLSIVEGGKITLDFLSDNYYSFTGRQRGEVRTYESLMSNVHPDDKSRLIIRIQELIAEPRSAEIECRVYVGNSHEVRWVSICGKSEWDEGQNRVKAIYGAVTDVTETKLAERAIKESNVRFERLADSIQAFISYVNADTLRYEFVNEAYAKAFGIPREKIIGSRVKDIIGDANYQFAEKFIEEAKSGRSTYYENTFDMTSGKRWMHVNYSPVIGSAGHVESIAVLNFDITERKQREEIQAKTQKLLEISQRLAHIGSWEYDLAMGKLYWSDEMYRIAGLPVGAPMSREIVESFFPPGELTRSRAALSDVLDRERPYSTDYKVIRRDGEFITIHNEGELIRDENGKAERVSGTTQDVTDQKRAKEALLESQRQIEFILGATKTGLDIIDAQFNVCYIDPQWSKVYGKWEGRKCWEYFQVGTAPCSGCSCQQALETKQITSRERVLKNEGNRPVQVTSIPYQDKDGKWLVAEVTVDISQHKTAEEAQRENEILLETLMENLGAGVIIVDARTRVIEKVNTATAELFGTPVEKIEGRICHKFLCPAEEDACPITDLHQEVDRSDRILLRADGTSVPVIKTVKRISIEGRDKLVETFIDISERKLAERALQESEERFRSIIEQSTDGTVVTDEDGTVFEWNKAQEILTGVKRKDAVGKALWDLQAKMVPAELKTPEVVDRIKTDIKAFLKGEKDWSLGKRERRIALPDGANKTVLESAFLVRKGDGHIGVTVLDDITERKNAETEKARLEQYLQQAQRLDSLGVLAGGIAHDFNNILMGIFGFTDLAKSQIKDEAASEYLSQALRSMERAKALTQQLLTFSKGGAPVRRTSSIGPLINETCGFALHGSNVKCDISISQDLWRCNVDKNQIGQVIENLMINAIQAMPMGGNIEVTATNISLQEGEHPTLDEGDYVLVSIKDQGIGISKEMLPRIFDPFFTTKTKGHGLGLSIAYSIMNRHDGAINVQSEAQKGTTFQLYFPACEGSENEQSDVAQIKHVGTGRILVMDDDEAVRKLVTRMLESFGYSAVGKANGKEAIEAFLEETGKGSFFAGMILDLTIPGGLGGKEVAEAIRKVDKTIPLFVSSGYAGDPILANPRQYGFDAAISKPYRMVELIEVLERYMRKKTGIVERTCLEHEDRSRYGG